MYTPNVGVRFIRKVDRFRRKKLSFLKNFSPTAGMAAAFSNNVGAALGYAKNASDVLFSSFPDLVLEKCISAARAK